MSVRYIVETKDPRYSGTMLDPFNARDRAEEWVRQLRRRKPEATVRLLDKVTDWEIEVV